MNKERFEGHKWCLIIISDASNVFTVKITTKIYIEYSYTSHKPHHVGSERGKRDRSHGDPEISLGPPRKLLYSIAGASFIIHVQVKMAASFLNRIAALGIGVAAIGGVVNTALYNGKMQLCLLFLQFGGFGKKRRMIWKIVEDLLATSTVCPHLGLSLINISFLKKP